MSLAAIILTPEPPQSSGNGEQLELLSPTHLLESALKPYLLSMLQPIVLVLGHDYHRILNRLKNLPSKVKVVIHRKPERGLPSALQVGLSALGPEVTGIVIAKGDQIIEARVLERLLKSFENQQKKGSSQKHIIVSMYHGKKGFPWIVSSELRKSLTHFDGDLTLLSFLKENKKHVLTVAADGPVAESDS